MKISGLENRFFYKNEKKFNKKQQLEETLKLINDDRQRPVFYTTSFNDIINSLDKVEGIRVSYIPENKTFLYADVNQWVHPMMLIQALNQGLFSNITNYTQLKSSNKVFDFGITNKEQGIQDFYNDSYTIRRDYGNFTIMTREDQDVFEKTDIQNILSKYSPKEIVKETLEYNNLENELWNLVRKNGSMLEMDWFITEFIDKNRNSKLIQELINQSGLSSSDDLYEYICEYTNKKICNDVLVNVYKKRFNEVFNELNKELSKNNKVYRSIVSDRDIKTILEISKQQGIGNCWAKQEKNARPYNYNTQDNKKYYEYIFEAEIDEDNVDWKTSLYVRLFNDEDEIRIKGNSNIKVLSIFSTPYPYDRYNPQSKKYNINEYFPVGLKYYYADFSINK